MRDQASNMATDEELLDEVYELVKDRPCHWAECVRGDPEGPRSHPFCQQIRLWLARYRGHRLREDLACIPEVPLGRARNDGTE
jgi:hypothetical protein